MKEEMQISLQSIIARNPEIIHNNIDGEVVIMSITKNNFYGIDKIGSHIWELLENSRSVDEIITVMMQDYEVERETCEKDVIDFLDEALKNELITIG
jgi:hypothetical protein